MEKWAGKRKGLTSPVFGVCAVADVLVFDVVGLVGGQWRAGGELGSSCSAAREGIHTAIVAREVENQLRVGELMKLVIVCRNKKTVLGGGVVLCRRVGLKGTRQTSLVCHFNS